MAIESHTVIEGSQSGDRINITIVFTATNGETISITKLVPVGSDYDAIAILEYESVQTYFEDFELSEAFDAVQNGENPDKTAEHVTQVDFDRKVLGYLMTIVDCHKVNNCLPFWQAVQGRNGNNATQRAENLGVPKSEYDEVADRLNLYFGVSSFLADDLLAIWQEPKEAWE